LADEDSKAKELAERRNNDSSENTQQLEEDTILHDIILQRGGCLAYASVICMLRTKGWNRIVEESSQGWYGQLRSID